MLHSRKHRSGKPFQTVFKVSLQEISHREGQEEHQRHNAQKDRYTKHRMRQPGIDAVCGCRFLLAAHHAFFHNFFYIIVFLIDDVFFIIFFRNMTDIHRMVLHDLRILLQKLHRMPAHVFHIAVF